MNASTLFQPLSKNNLNSINRINEYAKVFLKRTFLVLLKNCTKILKASMIPRCYFNRTEKQTVQCNFYCTYKSKAPLRKAEKS